MQASSAGPPEASAGKVVQAREAVAWQAPVGPSDDGIRGSMDASKNVFPRPFLLCKVGATKSGGTDGTRTNLKSREFLALL